jgi:hypothetical protein
MTLMWFYILLYRKALVRLCAFLLKRGNMYSKSRVESHACKTESEESSLWKNSGFLSFKRRIDEQLQLNGFDDSLVDDETLLPLYRMGESETYVLSALGCAVGI